MCVGWLTFVEWHLPPPNLISGAEADMCVGWLTFVEC